MSSESVKFETRLRRAEDVLARVSEGDFDQRLELTKENDALAGLEMGINFLIADLRSSARKTKEQHDRLLSQQKELEAKLKFIEQQAVAIRELRTPVIEIWNNVLVLPIVGVVDSQRAIEISDNLLAKIVEKQAQCAIIDVTGVAVIDTQTADHLLKVARSARLLGTRCVLTGLSPAIAQTLVAIGADLEEITTLRNLKAGLLDCLEFLRSQAAARDVA